MSIPANPAASIVDRRALGSKLTVQQQIGRPVACRGTVGDPGHLVDPDVLRACLRPALEPETGDLAPQAASATTAR